MSKIPDLCQRLRSLIALARREGWKVCLTDGRQKLVKPGFPPIFTGTPGDRHD